jgi:hypothetical protein
MYSKTSFSDLQNVTMRRTADPHKIFERTHIIVRMSFISRSSKQYNLESKSVEH